MTRYICIHGHFYQPPRENAWLETIEYQDSAAPYHDWNERITEECYGPNGVSRILDDDYKIVDIVNNYSRISFNFGPTLLSWLEVHKPKTYRCILEADRESAQRFGGHGSALAQVYNHVIMPLANRRDKETQIIWGIADFEKRFNRRPEGMWLAETAVDLETLELLAKHGVAFTILAPRQANRFRPEGTTEWTSGIDTRRPYWCKLPGGKRIALFFYDGDRSQEVAFKGILKDGKHFAESLMAGFDDRTTEQLVHIATDGESYGHHHRHGDMALAYCIRHIENEQLARITNYGEYLELFPPTHEVEIFENSSWSCVHGIERWRSNCGCNSGREGWNQAWREPLRNALNWLRDALDAHYEDQLARYHKNPWEVRNQYIHLILDRSIAHREAFVKTHFGPLKNGEKTHVIRLLEMQRNAQLMFTSCGWFFDEISGIETVQVMQYASRAIQLCETEVGVKLEGEFLLRLEQAPSNLAELVNGRGAFEKYVKPSQLTLTQIGMQYAVSSLFAEDPTEIEVFNYECVADDFRRFSQGSQRLAVGQTTVNSKITASQKQFRFVVLYLGQHHIIGKSFDNVPVNEFNPFVEKVIQHFNNSNISAIIEQFQQYPQQRNFSFFDMFKDEQIKMLNRILTHGLELAAQSYEKINERNYNLINVMRTQGLAVPRLLERNLEIAINNDLRKVLQSSRKRMPVIELRRVIREIQRWNLEIDNTEYNYLASIRLNELAQQLATDEKRTDLLTNMQRALELLARADIRPELNEVQDIVFHLLKSNFDADNLAWREGLIAFANYINLDTEVILQGEGMVG